MEKKVLSIIEKYNLIENGDKVVVGVSGGPDSMALLKVLFELRDVLDIQIFVAHINHMIRQEAEEETKYVEDSCKKLGLKCYIKYENVLKVANEEKISVEEAGRNVRYKFFEEIFDKVGANRIATAHNANDNAETVLMNITRGTGLSGLKGIEIIRDNKFIRPLLECSREEIEKYCDKEQLCPKYDKSNNDNVYTRNKIRNKLIPYLKDEFNPNIITSLNRLSEIVAQESQFIEEQSLIEYNKILLGESTKQLVLDLKKFNKLNRVIKNRIILFSIDNLLGNTQGIEKIHIDDIVKLCERNVGNKFLMPNKNLKVLVKNSKIFLELE